MAEAVAKVRTSTPAQEATARSGSSSGSRQAQRDAVGHG